MTSCLSAGGGPREFDWIYTKAVGFAINAQHGVRFIRARLPGG